MTISASAAVPASDRSPTLPRRALESGIHEILRPTPLSLEPRRLPRPPELPRARRGPGRYDRRITTTERRCLQHEHLLDAAARVFARVGFARATVAMVLDESGLSRGTFYRHFDDLDDVLIAVRQRAAKQLFDAIEAKVREEANPAAQLCAGITAFLAFIGQHGDMLRVLRRESRKNEVHERIRSETEARFLQLLRTGITNAYEAGIVKRPPTDTTVYALVAAIEGVGLRYIESGDDQRAIEAAPALVELCFRALA